MVEEAFNSEEDKLSKINSAGLINITIENLWKDCYTAMSSGDFLKWNRKLDAIWLILGGEKNAPEDKFNEIDLSLYEMGSLSASKVGFNSLPDGWNEKRNKQYLKLRQKSLFLRRLQNNQGKGTAYADEDEDDF